MITFLWGIILELSTKPVRIDFNPVIHIFCLHAWVRMPRWLQAPAFIRQTAHRPAEIVCIHFLPVRTASVVRRLLTSSLNERARKFLFLPWFMASNVESGFRFLLPLTARNSGASSQRPGSSRRITQTGCPYQQESYRTMDLSVMHLVYTRRS